jgi:hypothetical protein
MNLAKFESVYNFNEDFKLDKTNGQGLVFYLNKERETNKIQRNQWRKAITAIEKEMLNSFDYCIDQFSSENQLHSQMMTNMHDMYITGMRL